MPLQTKTYQKLARSYRAACNDGTPDRFFEDLDEGLQKKQIESNKFDVRPLFENFVRDGREIVDSWNPQHGGRGVQLFEAGDYVDTSAFSKTMGQIVYTEVLQAFENPMFIQDSVATTVDTKFNGEKIPGVSRLGDVSETIAEGDDYPTVGLSEDFVETPVTTKRGVIVPVTKEAIFFDRTDLILPRARNVSEVLAISKEKRALDMATGQTTSYKRSGRAAVATYGDDSGNHDWDNLQASNALVDWEDIEAAELLFDGLTDPATGEPIIVNFFQLLVPTALKHTARRIVNATTIQQVDNQANASTIRTESANPLDAYEILTNAYVKLRTSSATTWFIGDFKGAFEYRQNWPVTSVEAPSNSHDEFHSDIVIQFKISERGTYAVKEPRKVVKCTA